MRVIVESHIGKLEFATALDVHLVRTVNENVGDGLVTKQRFQWTQPEHLVLDAFDDGLARRKGQRRLFLVQQTLADSADLAACLALGQAADQRQVHDFEQALIHQLLTFLFGRREWPHAIVEVACRVPGACRRIGADRLHICIHVEVALRRPEKVRARRLRCSAATPPNLSWRVRTARVMAAFCAAMSNGVPVLMHSDTVRKSFGTVKTSPHASVVRISSTVISLFLSYRLTTTSKRSLLTPRSLRMQVIRRVASRSVANDCCTTSTMFCARSSTCAATASMRLGRSTTRWSLQRTATSSNRRT